jgi:predicted phosphodiesterase
VGKGEFLFSLGDIDPLADNYWTIQKYLGPNYPWYPVVGNHDSINKKSAPDMAWLRSYNAGGRRLPHVVSAGLQNGVETNYSFDYANCHFVVLNEYYNGKSDHVLTRAEGRPASNVGDALYQWLKADLNATTKKFIFVVGHEPAYVQPDLDYGTMDNFFASLNVHPTSRNRFWKLLKSKGVVAYLCGHTHSHSCVKVDGVWQIDAGHARGGRGSTFVRIHVTDTAVTFESYHQDDANVPYSLKHTWRLFPAPENQRPIPFESARNGLNVSTTTNMAVPIRVMAQDPDGDCRTQQYTVVRQPAHGNLAAVNPPRERWAFGQDYIYTPDAGYNGKDGFTFTASDGQADSYPISVAITVAATLTVGTMTITPADGEGLRGSRDQLRGLKRHTQRQKSGDRRASD